MQTGPRWYAVRVKSNFEKKTSEYISAIGYDVFLPLYRSLRRWSDRTRESDFPLFPGYTFCRFDAALSSPISSAPGVLNVVGIGRTPVAVDDEEIAGLRTAIRSNRMCEPWPYLAAGTKILIQEGPLRGLEGILIEVKNERRLIASVTLLQRSVSVEISRSEALIVQSRPKPGAERWI